MLTHLRTVLLIYNQDLHARPAYKRTYMLVKQVRTLVLYNSTTAQAVTLIGILREWPNVQRHNCQHVEKGLGNMQGAWPVSSRNTPALKEVRDA